MVQQARQALMLPHGNDYAPRSKGRLPTYASP